jgi:hypothetical protein
VHTDRQQLCRKIAQNKLSSYLICSVVISPCAFDSEHTSYPRYHWQTIRATIPILWLVKSAVRQNLIGQRARSINYLDKQEAITVRPVATLATTQ